MQSDKVQSSDHGEVRSIRNWLIMVEDTETLETTLESASTSVVIETIIIDTSFSGTAITVPTKDGLSIELVSDTQDNHSEMELSSKLDQDFQERDHLLSKNTLEDINIDLESKTTTHGISSNGLSSTEDQELSELPQIEEELFQEDKVTDSEMETLLLLESTETKQTKRFPSGPDNTETSETTTDNVSMFTVHLTLTTDTPSGTSAITEETKCGTLIQRPPKCQDTH